MFCRFCDIDYISMQSYTKNLAELPENAYICKLDEYQIAMTQKQGKPYNCLNKRKFVLFGILKRRSGISRWWMFVVSLQIVRMP